MGSVIYIEIRQAEGGLDSRDLVRVQVGIYEKFAIRRGL
jgi:protein subunit release factor B